MSAPRRRPLTLDHLDIEHTLKHAVAAAPRWELGIAALRDAARDVDGWPARSGEATTRTAPVSARCLGVGCTVVCHDSEAERKHTAATGHELYAYETPRPTDAGGGIDYADPTGDQAGTLGRLQHDLDDYTLRWHRIRQDLHAIAAIALRNTPPATPAEPACAVTTCDGVVERTPNGGYRGMRQINGHWVVKHGERPVCSAHRRRDVAA